MRAWTSARGSTNKGSRYTHYAWTISTFLYSVTSYHFHIRGMFEGVGVSSETVYILTRASSYDEL
jgi:hypothetical protein